MDMAKCVRNCKIFIRLHSTTRYMLNIILIIPSEYFHYNCLEIK